MPAPTIVLSAPPQSPITYTLQQITERGWRISGTVTQTPPGGDWSYNLSVGVLVASEVDAEDQTHAASRTGKFVYNEYPTLTSVAPKIQALVDEMFDNLPQDA